MRRQIESVGRAARARDGFTILELLTVMAIIAILLGILVGGAGTVRRSALKAKTRSQFNQYAIAYEQFRAEYGYYPTMDAAGDRFDLRGDNEVFIQTLSGRTRTGEAATESYAREANRHRISLYEFSAAEFSADSLNICGEQVAEGAIVDAFGNPHISVIVDSDGDGIVIGEKEERINAGAIFFSSRRGCNEWQDVKSWE